MNGVNFDYVEAIKNLPEDGMAREHLKSLRLQHGLTQQDVADFLGVTKSTISKYEKGLRSINQSHIISLSKLYGVTRSYILWGADYVDSSTSQPVDIPVEDMSEEKRSRIICYNRLTALNSQLNEEGLKKLIERAKELLEIPRYKRNKED